MSIYMVQADHYLETCFRNKIRRAEDLGNNPSFLNAHFYATATALQALAYLTLSIPISFSYNLSLTFKKLVAIKIGETCMHLQQTFLSLVYRILILLITLPCVFVNFLFPGICNYIDHFPLKKEEGGAVSNNAILNSIDAHSSFVVLKEPRTPMTASLKQILSSTLVQQLGFQCSQIDLKVLDDSSQQPVQQVQKVWSMLNQDPISQESYTQFVLELRKAVSQLQIRKSNKPVIALDDTDEEEKISTVDCQPLAICQELITQIAYERFNVSIFDALTYIVELGSGSFQERSFDLHAFHEELNKRNALLDHLSVEEVNLSRWHRLWIKFSGHYNLYFEAASKRNIPYRDSQFKLAGRTITILRHGTPFYHHSSSQLNFNEDYMAFLERATSNNEKILQIVLENVAAFNERERVYKRLTLNDTFPDQVYVCALNMDNEFFKNPPYEERLEKLKTVINDKIWGKLEETTYQIPERIQSAITRRDVSDVLSQVEKLYFSNNQGKLENAEEGQAFILLFYAHFTLFLCEKLNISFLEAFCKDDIDRGNSFKVIFKLILLYNSGQLKNKDGTLTKTAELYPILIHLLGAPLMVKAQGIVSSRKQYIEIVLKQMLKAAPPTQIRPSFDLSPAS